jgi:hypothetical protein
MAKKGLDLPTLNDFVQKVEAVIKPNTDPKEFEAYLAEHRFNLSKLPPENVKLFYYNGLLIGSRQNIVSIMGKAKSRKTVLASAIATSAFLQDGQSFLGFSCDLAPEEKILHIDTEQGYYHYYYSVKRIFDDAGLSVVPERFDSIYTRDATIDFRIELIEYLIQKNRPAVVIIDGVTDLTYDINDQKEASRVGERLLGWSGKYDCLIIVVIHETKSTGFMTGAIGTYLEKKSETVIKVVKEEELDSISSVSCQYSRNKAFSAFSIEYDEAKNHYVIVDDQRVTTKGSKGDKRPQAYPDDIHELILKRAFNVRSALQDFELNNGLVKAIKHVTQDEIRAKQVKLWIDYYQEKTWLFKNPIEGAWMRPEDVPRGLQTGLNFETAELPHSDASAATDDLPF